MIDEDWQQQMAEARAIAAEGDPALYGPLLKQLDAAKTEQDEVIAMFAITLARLDELEKLSAEFRDSE